LWICVDFADAWAETFSAPGELGGNLRQSGLRSDYLKKIAKRYINNADGTV